ncbi:MAG: hypothetical protein DCF26_10970 [Burkholderiales bacterium]|nr:MAG: hypothetical protein DCF26_10970 [Burkholderiales bacterium]
MYAWLSLENVDGNTTTSVTPCRVDPIHPPETDEGKLKLRRTIAMQAIAALKLPDSVENNRLFAALSQLLKSLPADYEDIEFAVYMGLAHHRLPPARRAAREHVINAVMEGYLGPSAAWPKGLQLRLDLIRNQLFLIPNALLEGHARSACGALLMNTSMTLSPATPDPQARSDFDLIRRVAGSVSKSPGDAAAIFDALRLAYVMTQLALRKPFMNFLKDQTTGPAVAMAAQTQATLLARVPMGTVALQTDTLVTILMDVAMGMQLAPAAPSIEEIVGDHLAGLQRDQDRAYDQIRIETVAALDAGVPMGNKGLLMRQVLLKERLAVRQLNLRLAPKRTALAQAQPTNTFSQGGNTDMDPVHAWSVARLVRWIEGPLAERSTQGRLNRSTVVTYEKEALVRDAQDREQAGLLADGATPMVTEADVDTAMNDGLGATAQFFHDDIQEMAPLAKSLGAAAGLLERCLELQVQLQGLCDKPAAIDEEKARVLLQDAESRIAELRKGIKVAETSAQQTRRFSAQLALALNAETLVLGKRHGGVIACPLRPTDWAWVAQMFHRRWLPQVTRLLIDGQPIALQPDQAVALYVTGSSQSNFAFDVSVHLWQRRAGCTSPPSELMDNCPPMNEADWFDTYIPCAVLHVPPAG